MTTEQLKDKTDEELRVMCAELCGAKWYLFASGYSRISFNDLTSPHYNSSNSWTHSVRPDNPKLIKFSDSVPNYPADLNAMHEAEKHLPAGKWTSYENCLMKLSKEELIASGIPAVDAARICTIHAPARQRCIAFIAVMEGKVTAEQALIATGQHEAAAMCRATKHAANGMEDTK